MSQLLFFISPFLNESLLVSISDLENEFRTRNLEAQYEKEKKKEKTIESIIM